MDTTGRRLESAVQGQNNRRIAAGYGLTVAVELLNKSETNIINSVEEGIGFVRMFSTQA